MSEMQVIIDIFYLQHHFHILLLRQRESYSMFQRWYQPFYTYIEKIKVFDGVNIQ